MIGFEQKLPGYAVLLVGILAASRGNKQYFCEIAVLAGCIAFLGIVPIGTDIRIGHATVMFIAMWVLLLVPFFVFRDVFKEKAIAYKWRGTPRWTRVHLAYFVIVVILAYLFIPFYLVHSGVYLNWPAATDLDKTVRLFIGTNLLGLWDELFFVCTVLTILRRQLPFTVANIFMSMVFSSFLYDLGFRSWGIFVVIIFTLLQGYIYKQTKSLPFVVAIHLTFDLILFFALINAHQPERFNFFLV